MSKEEAVEVEEKTIIRPDTSEYVKSRSAKGGASMHNGDSVAVALDGATVEEVYSLTAEVLETTVEELQAKYGHLNIGQQRMNLGNRLRGVRNRMEKETEGTGDKFIADVSSGLREAVEKRRESEAAAKAKVAEEKAAKAKAAEEKPKPKAKTKKAA